MSSVVEEALRPNAPIAATMPNDMFHREGEVDAHPFDSMHPCCIKETKMRTKALENYEKMAAVDITRIALERKHINIASLPDPREHTAGCCSHKHDNTKELLSEMVQDSSDSDSDLDAMLDGFDADQPANIFEENLDHLKQRRLARLKHDLAEEGVRRRHHEAVRTELRVTDETAIGGILRNAQRAVCLIVADKSLFLPKTDSELESLLPKEFIARIINDRMKAMAPYLFPTQFLRLEAPSSTFLSNFHISVSNLPMIMCLDMCNVVAKTSSMEEFTDGTLGIRKTIQNFDDWVEKAGMLKPSTTMLGSNANARLSDGDDDDADGAFECGQSGCLKTFYHEHIGINGRGRDAQTL